MTEERKNGKWTLQTAIAWLRKNGHNVGEKQVHLSHGAGIHAYGCADFLKNVHKFEVFLPERPK